ncbi:hypothetical protein JCM21900_006173 [Sporobolomyces salmonicolor]
MYGIPPPPPSDPSLSSTAPRPSPKPRTAPRPADPNALAFARPLPSLQRILTEHQFCWIVGAALLAWEAVVCAGVIHRVNYTEIDFRTYLQQVEVFLSGERDYSLFKGDTGPAVYPAGHIYAYSLLHRLTDGGKHLQRAQWVFAGVYVATMALVFAIYSKGRRVPPYALIFLTISKRLHSLYVLRMFNDCIAMLFLYAAVCMYSTEGGSRREVGRRWIWGTLLFSLALSVKMSILLFLPALLYLLFVYHSPLTCFLHVALLALSQALLASPFLTTPSHALAYLRQAFDFHRTFLWEWTVNWRWLGEEAFEDPVWSKVLLGAHAAALVLFASRWAEAEGGVSSVLARAWTRPGQAPAWSPLTAERTVTLLFTSNLVGVACARSLHYQFYAWFAHQLVWLLWSATDFEPMQALVLTSLIEYGFHAFPSTVNSSLGLVISLLVVLVGIYYGRPVGEETRVEREGEKRKDE